jgi:hypothetical protein
MSSNSSEVSHTPSNYQFRFNPYLFDAGIVLLLALTTLFINWKMIRDGYNGLGDLLWHITWVQHFYKQLAEGIWYPRWLAGTNFGYGSPTFVFYPPFVYYLGSALRLIGLNIEQTITGLFSLALFGSGICFYIYGLNKWGKTVSGRIASSIGALCYMTVPAIANVIYFGGLAALFAMPFIPIGLYLTDQALFRPKWRFALAIFWAIMALTHVPSLLIYTIAWIFYILFFLLKRSWKSVIATILSAGIGFGMVSFYLLPAILEQSFVTIEVMRKSKGGFQENLLGSSTLQIFPLHNLDRGPYIFIHQSLAIIILTIIILVCCHKKPAIIQETWRWIAFMIVLVFLMSYWSLPIWQASRILQMIQFPLRLVGLYSFGGAALAGLAVNGILKLPLRFRILPFLIIIGIILANFKFAYQLSRAYPALHNPGRGKVENIERLKIALYAPYTDKLIDVPEYRPFLKNHRSSPPVPVIGQPPVSVVTGKAAIQINQWNSYNRRFQLTVEENSVIRIRTYYYPAWHLYVNKKNHSIDVSDDGTMELKLEPGFYEVELHYQWTRYFTVGVVLSLFSILALVLFWLKTPKTSMSLSSG